jgi:hypothetical protein
MWSMQQCRRLEANQARSHDGVECGELMKIGLIDVDGGKFPNLALMKIATSHDEKGDHVEWWNGLKTYDIVYKSKVFTDRHYELEDYPIFADQVISGGTGYDMKLVLPNNIEHMYPKYDMYGIENTAYGFLTRGCPRNCAFCIVAEKEGTKVQRVADISEFWRGQKEIKLLDSNITASKECESIFDSLIKTKSWIEFNGGLDIRSLTDKGAAQLNDMKIRMIHFAWDNYEFKTYEKLKHFRPLLKKRGRELTVYVLVNFNTTTEQDLERIYKLRELDYTPYVMIFDKPNAPKLTKQIARWVNNRFVWQTCATFEEYNSSI